jgi:cobalt-zinc-cadmium efflux system protein
MNDQQAMPHAPGGNCGHGHAHDQEHGHWHGHVHGHGIIGGDAVGRAFAIGIVLNTGFVCVEAVYGLLANSMALLADAGHNLSDVLSLLLAWGATVLARRGPTGRRTYGLKKSSIMASLANAVLLLVVTGAIAREAIRRFAVPQPVAGDDVVVVAAIGVVINGLTALLFMSGRKRDINVKGAFLHMAADAGVSLAVVAAAVAMMATGWLWLDPLMSLVIVAVIAVGTWGLLRDSLDMALDAVPAGIDELAVTAYLAGLPGVAAVHDLHIWGMSTTETALTAHLVRPEAGIDDAWLSSVSEALHQRFGIAHATIQVENGDGPDPCRLAPPDVV